MKQILMITLGLLIAILFIFAVFKFLPLGLVIAVIGGCLATLYWTSKDITTKIIGSIGGFIYIAGIIYSFVSHGLIEGLGALILGFLAYHYARK